MLQSVTTKSFFELVQQHKGLIVAKLYASWCGTCRLIAKPFERMTEKPEYQDILFLDIDAEAEPEIRQWIGKIENLPTIAIIKDGKVLEAHPFGKVEIAENTIKKYL